MSTKRISVNPDFFNIGRRKTKKKLSHSLRTNFNSLQKNILKDKMINKIKEFKKKQKRKKEKNNEINNNEFENEYKDAINFMEDIIKKKTKKRTKKRTKKLEKMANDVGEQNILKVNTEPNISSKLLKHSVPDVPIVPNVLNNVKNDPPYGILKNGKKPLYSKYRKSVKANEDPLLNIKPHASSHIKDSNIVVFTDETQFGQQLKTNLKPINNISISHNPINKNRQNKLENLKENFMLNKNKNKKKEKFKVKNKKIMKRFILGKNSKTRKVAILIKNKKTRRLINKDCNFLKKKKLKQVKSVLVNNALIKVGTQAPESLLRDMYLNRHLAGDIKNSGGKNAEEILMHNWNRETS